MAALLTLTLAILVAAVVPSALGAISHMREAYVYDTARTAASVAELAARHVAVERLAVEPQPGRDALDDRGQPGAVGLPGGGEAEGAHERLHPIGERHRRGRP